MIEGLLPAPEPDRPEQNGHTDPLGLIAAELRALRADFAAKIRYDEGQEQILAAMGAELDQHRQGVFRMQLKPVLLDLVAMYDDLSQLIDSPESSPATSQALDLVRGTVLDTLARNGAEQIASEDDAVDRTVHKVVRMVTTDDPAEDRRIAARLRPGFRWNDRVLRPEWVNVYRYQASTGAVTPERAASTEATSTENKALDPGPEPAGADTRQQTNSAGSPSGGADRVGEAE